MNDQQHTSRRARRFGLLPALAGAWIAALAVTPAAADEFVDRVNGLFADIRSSLRSDPIVLGAIADMEPPPASVDSLRDAMLLPAGASAWQEAESWASGAPQQAVLEAIGRVTESAAERRPMAFGQPYGLTELGSSPEQIALIQSGLYTDLGDPPLLAGARHLYLDDFDDVTSLVQVEATRRLAAGDPLGSLDVLTDWMLFARQIAGREFYAEKAWAFDTMTQTLERMRDVVYQDFRGDRDLTGADLRDTIQRLQDERGPLSIDRITLPRADFIATEQLIATVIQPRGNVRTELFASTMARLASNKRPLRLFGEAARWEQVAASHANWFDTSDALTAIRGDYEFRWPRDSTDPLLDRPFAVARYADNPVLGDATATVTQTLPDMRNLFDKRFLLRVELVGTRQALGLVGFERENGSYPLDLSAIRPRFVVQIAPDPFAPPSGAGSARPLYFFVPIRDTRDRFSDRQTVPPHEITVLVADAPNVSIRLRDDQFVLYSVGPDGSRQWADEVQNSIDAPPGRDYLLWPPVLSIVRDTLVQSGEIR